MQTNREKLINAHSKLIEARLVVAAMTRYLDDMRKKVAVILAIIDNHNLWPEWLTIKSFAEFEVDLGLLEATTGLAEARLAEASACSSSAMTAMKQKDYFDRLRTNVEAAPDGETVDEHVEKQITQIAIHVEDIHALRDEAMSQFRQHEEFL
jgi:hypothetical protein